MDSCAGGVTLGRGGRRVVTKSSSSLTKAHYVALAEEYIKKFKEAQKCKEQ